MLEPFKSLFQLHWTNQPYLAPLPKQIARTFIPASDIDASLALELLVCQPQARAPAPAQAVSSSHGRHASLTHADRPRPPAILFLHGGFGSAAMYADFMVYLSRHYDAPTYALSMRGRGGSYAMSYWQLVYRTGLDELSEDINRAIQHINAIDTTNDTTINTRYGHQQDQQQQQQPRLIVLGHSSGGGLLQYALSHRKIPQNTVSAIILLDAIPNFGNLSVYANWARLDPWFGMRMFLVHLNHVSSPLSSDTLVTSAFFGPEYARLDKKHKTRIAQFRSLMAPYESLLWPLSMMKGWWSWFRGSGGSWIDPRDVLIALRRDQQMDLDSDHNHNHNYNRSESEMEMKKGIGEKVCVMVGSEDKLMDIPHQKSMVDQYRRATRDLIQSKKIDPLLNEQKKKKKNNDSIDETDLTGVRVSSEDGVRFVIVEGAGHHVQNDLMWEKAAEQVRRFASRV